MLTAYRTPNVYFEWLDSPPELVGIRTDIAGFVGIAESGPLFKAVKVESWTQFTSIFGGHTPYAFLAYAVEGFFANEGKTCWIVRVADETNADSAKLNLCTENNFVELQTRTPGSWGKLLTITLQRSLLEGRFSLTLRLPNGAQEVWRDVSIDEPDEPRYLPDLLNDERKGSRLIQAMLKTKKSNSPALNLGNIEFVTTRFGHLVTSKNSNDPDGLKQLQPLHFLQGLAKLGEVDEVSILAMPDIMPKHFPPVKIRIPDPRCHILEERPIPSLEPTKLILPRPFSPDEIENVQQAMIGQCLKLKDRVAILDTPFETLEPTDVLTWRTRYDAKYAAMYYPWLQVPDPLRLEGLSRLIPPTGHVAGIFARVDRQVGVHKPPANETITGVLATAFPINDIDHGRLNDTGINVIRAYNGRGIRIAGARTLSSESEWRFLNIRRLLLMIGETLDEQLQWTVFEPNSPILWNDIARVIRNFLNTLWQQGQLDGATADEAYHVICDESTNPPYEIDRGRIVCEIGLQPPWPAEFIIVRIGKTEGGLEILE